MGNTGTNSRLDESQHKINHPRLKQVKYKKNNEIMQVKLNVEDIAQFQKWQNKLATLKKFDQYYLLLPKIYQYNKTGMCGSSGMLQIDYDNYPLILTDQIHNRQKNNNYFNQTELWYLLYGLVSSSSILKKLGNKIGDVRSHNIFMNNQGQIKISNVYSWPNQRTNYQKLLFQNTLTYLSPEQLEYVRQGRTDILKDNFNGKQKYNKYVAESFSIGLTMLEAMLLKSSSSLYNAAERSIDREELQCRVQKLLLNNSTNNNNTNNNNIKYSKCLRMIVAGLCQYTQQDRLNSIDVYQHIKCYDNQLINLKQCNIQTPATKNKNKYQQLILGNVNKIQPIVNNTYNTNTFPNTYNYQTGTHPSEIYQNNTGKYNNSNNYNYSTNINTSNNNINSSFNNVNTSIKFNNYTKTIPTYNANSNINTYNAYSTNNYNPNFNNFSTYANSNINSNTYNNSNLNSYNFKYDCNINKNTFSINNYSDHLFYKSEDSNNKIGIFTSSNYYTSPITSSIDKYQYQYPFSLTNNTSYPFPTSTNVPTSNINKPLLTVNNPGLPTIQQVKSNKTSIQTKNHNIQVIESANNYLKSVYGISSTVQTPTFNKNINSINNTMNNYNKNTNTFNFSKDNNNNIASIPQSNQQKFSQHQDIKLTTNTKTINNQSNNTYTFSNISSIPKYQYSYQSANKIGDNIAMFTPTHPTLNKNININDNQNENYDDGINLLKKINQDVNRSNERNQ